MNIMEACEDPALFAPWFKDRATWAPWFAFLRALFGLPMSLDEREIYRQATGRNEPPSSQGREAWLICGRRAGKSFILALIAVFLACFRDWTPYLAPGERGTIVIVAADRKQGRAIMGYLTALLQEIPLLAAMVGKINAEDIELTNGVSIEVATCSFRTIRSRTIVAALCDEIAFWSDDSSANPDTEVLAAIKPATATIPGAMLLCASSPHARRGVMWNTFAKWFGKEGGPLVWRATTREMNPTVPQEFVDEEIAKDPASASAEYLALFRTDVETLLSQEAVSACVEMGVVERPSERRHRYIGFVDPSGGASDSMTLAIAHKDGDTAVLDAVRERKAPFSPEAVVDEFVELLKKYRITRVIGDRYAGEWPREQFGKRGIHYLPSEKSKSQIYLDMVPLVNSQATDLLDHSALLNQLIGLERRVVRGGRESIDHAPGAHDDIANAAAGALVHVPSASRMDRPAGSIHIESALKYNVHSGKYGSA
jgi:hypothetical protein